MRPLLLVILLRLSLLVAVAASAVLLVEHQNAGDPAFCGVGSGCFAVRMSPLSRPLGVPLPYVGLFAHAALLVGALLARTREHWKLLALASSAGAACAVVLLAVQQFVIGAFCVWCTIVDSASVVAAACAMLLFLRADAEARASKAPVPSTLRVLAASSAEVMLWGAAATLAVVLPFVWGLYPVIPPLPTGIAALQAPNKVTIVGFTDFQCPFCRKLNPDLMALKQKYEGRIHYDRRMMPLQGHPGALPAAQAYLCTPEEKREAAASWLYQAPDDVLTTTGVLVIAGDLGLDRAVLAKCMASPETAAALEKDKALYQSLNARGLPLTYVGTRMVLGYDPERIERSIVQEAKGESTSLPLSWLLATLGAVFLGVSLYAWRARKDIAEERAPDLAR